MTNCILVGRLVGVTIEAASLLFSANPFDFAYSFLSADNVLTANDAGLNGSVNNGVVQSFSDHIAKEPMKLFSQTLFQNFIQQCLANQITTDRR